MRFDFQFCSERGGSNLMTKIMDAHPDVCGPSPSHAMRVFANNYYRYGDVREDRNWRTLLEDVEYYMARTFSHWESSITAEELREQVQVRSLGPVLRYVYEKEAQAQGKQGVYVKENHAYSFNSFVLEHFRDSRFVLLVRDPRDMATCWMDSGFPEGIVGAATIWQRDQSESIKVYSYLKDFDKMLIVRFEDILTRSEETLRKVCSFLGLEYSPSMLKFYESPNVRRNAESNFAWSDLAKPIQSDNCELYKTELSEAEIRYVEAVCLPEMKFLGYTPEFADESTDVETCKDRLPPPAKTVPHTERFSDEQKDMRSAWQDAQQRIRSRALYAHP